ncbi:hypothetical protein LVISKB_2074 [Levilactobacillus brevis KB290]|uniref:Uncharacterized protein n=1 Tax=Levilactobacillus brevis KB290 TaxID=1001583 RepID=M5AFV9_LEVBR|nr:hypothetical protein LVISKB_2074 [Levilactobacillus brevis KB290]
MPIFLIKIYLGASKPVPVGARPNGANERPWRGSPRGVRQSHRGIIGQSWYQPDTAILPCCRHRQSPLTGIPENQLDRSHPKYPRHWPRLLVIPPGHPQLDGLAGVIHGASGPVRPNRASAGRRPKSGAAWLPGPRGKRHRSRGTEGGPPVSNPHSLCDCGQYAGVLTPHIELFRGLLDTKSGRRLPESSPIWLILSLHDDPWPWNTLHFTGRLSVRLMRFFSANGRFFTVFFR